MDAQRPVSAAPQVFNGWKEIAAYLGKSVRSVQRWEATLDFPVHRIHTADGVIVYADRDEIDAWRRKLDTPPLPEADPQAGDDRPAGEDRPAANAGPVPTAGRDTRPGRWWAWKMAAAGLLLFIAGAVSARWLNRPPDAAVEIKYVGRTIEGIGRNGALAWTYQFDSDVNSPRPNPTFVDLDGDGETEVLVPVRNTSRGVGAPISDSLYCFSRTGRLKWKVTPEQTFSFGGRTYGGPWHLREVIVSNSRAPRTIWIAFAHHTWYPGFVLQIDAAGSASVRYVQAGSLYSLAHWMTPAGGFLAVGGTSEEHAEATLALLADDGPAATFPAGTGRLECETCPPGKPSRIVLFAPGELAAANHELFPYVFALRVVGANLKVTIRNGPGNSVAELNPFFGIDSIQFGQHYWAAHHELQVKGLIGHDTEQCPERGRPRSVRAWTPAEGWRVRTVSTEFEDIDPPSGARARSEPG